MYHLYSRRGGTGRRNNRGIAEEQGEERTEIRRARQEDAQRIFALVSSSLDQYYAPSVIEYFMAQWPRGQLVAADPLGNILGYLAGSRLNGGRAGIALFCVDRRFRGLGIGSELLERFRTEALADGSSMIQLEVREGNDEALRFYSHRGFMPTERLEGFYTDGGTGIRMIGPARGGNCRSSSTVFIPRLLRMEHGIPGRNL